MLNNFKIQREINTAGTYEVNLKAIDFVPSRTITKGTETIETKAMLNFTYSIKGSSNVIIHRFFPELTQVEVAPGAYEEVMSPQSTEMLTNLILVPIMQQTNIEAEDLETFKAQLEGVDFKVVLSNSDRANAQGVPYVNYSYSLANISLDDVLNNI